MGSQWDTREETHLDPIYPSRVTSDEEMPPLNKKDTLIV